jgi:hypothetical protein
MNVFDDGGAIMPVQPMQFSSMVMTTLVFRTARHRAHVEDGLVKAKPAMVMMLCVQSLTTLIPINRF